MVISLRRAIECSLFARLAIVANAAKGYPSLAFSICCSTCSSIRET